MSPDAPTTPEPPRFSLPWGAVLAVVLLVGFEVGAARQDWFWGWVRFSQVGVIDALETQVLPGTDPQILFTGSSRVRDAISPRVMEEKLGLAEGSVLNLGLTMGTPFDTAILYRRNRDTLANAKLIFFGVEPYQFDRNNAPTERVLRYGSLRDRMALLGRGDRLHRTIGWLWRTLDTGPAMRRFAKSMLVPPPDDPPIAPDGRVQWRTRYDNKRARRRPARADAQRFFAYWGASATRQRQLTELLEMFDDDGIEVVVFQVPTRDRFWDYANRKYADKVKAYNKAVREASKGHDVYLFWGGKEHRLRAQNFYDYGHLRDKPAQRFTSKIAKLIRTAYADELKAARAEAPAEVAPRAHAPPGRTKRPRAKK